MNKVELEAKIEALQAALDTKSQEQNAYQGQIDTLKKELEDINKPKLTPAQFDKMYTAIEMGLETFDFDDVDNYSIDYGIDYDNRVTCESFCFDNVSEVAQEVYNHLSVLFAEIKEDDNQLNQD